MWEDREGDKGREGVRECACVPAQQVRMAEGHLQTARRDRHGERSAGHRHQRLQ